MFRSGSIRLTEILSGPDTRLPEAGLLFHSHLRRERSTILRPGGTIEYQSCLEVEQVDLEIFRHLCEEIRLDGSRDRLFHHFRSSNRLAPEPISHVLITARVNDLSIQSFHTFPDECAIVRTQSLFELKSRNRARMTLKRLRDRVGARPAAACRANRSSSLVARSRTRWRVDAADHDL